MKMSMRNRTRSRDDEDDDADDGLSKKKKQQQNCSSDFTPEFFKVFLPHLTANQLQIPRAFLHQFNGIIPEKLTLNYPGGKSWNVEVNETADGLFITKGWQNFVKNQALCPGDFLVFRYDGNATFTVKIFGINGCKKEFSALGNIATQIKIEDETDEVTEAKQTCSHHTRKADPNYSEESQKKPDKSSGFEKVRPSRSLRSTSRIAKRRSFHKATGLAENEVPYFIAPVSSWNKHRVLIPKKTVKKFDVKLKPEMFLCYHDQRWPVAVRKESDGRLIIGRGWITFWKENNLSLDKTFMFKFGTARAVEEIEVQVLPNARERLCGIKVEA